MAQRALLLMDLQNDIVHPDGKLGKGTMADEVARRGVLGNAKKALEAARAKGLPVAHVHVGYKADYSDVYSKSPRKERLSKGGAIVAGTWGVAFHDEVKPLDSEATFFKQSVNPFLTTPLLNWLVTNGITEVVLGGVATNMVVEATARHADDLGFAVTILEDCCASASEEMHQFAATKIFPGLGRVISADDFVASL